MSNIPLFPPKYQNPTKLPVHSMNSIYKAYDIERQRYVAIKVMKDDPHDVENDRHLRQLFQHEIELARLLKHPHILEALDTGKARLPHRSVPFITTPFMDEGSLAKFVEKSPPWHNWQLGQTIDLIMQAASALEYIHGQYISPRSQPDDGLQPLETRPLVHRDVKLDNFFVRSVNKPGRVVHIYLSDFGIARTQRITIDITHHRLGTIRSMPPEQFEGQLVPQSDQYSFAFMVCFLLTGKYPLNSDSGDEWVWYHLHKTGMHKPPTQLNPGIITSTAVDDVLLKALSANPEDRYHSILQFAEELRSALERQMASAPTDHTGSTLYIPMPPAQEPGPFSINSNEDDVDKRDGISEIATEPVQREKVAAPDLMIGWEAISPFATESSSRIQLPAAPVSICWSQDGNYLACLFEDHSPIILDNQWHKRNRLPVGAGHVACWAPDGYRLAISIRYSLQNKEHSKILIVDNALEKPLVFTLASFTVPAIDGMDWSSKGQLALWVSEQNSILLYAIPPVLTQFIPIQHFFQMPGLECGGLGTLRWSPDGSLLAAGTLDGALICWRADTNTIVWQKPSTREQIYSLCWSPDSASLIVSSGDGHITIWDVRQNRMVAQWNNLPMVARMLSITNQGLLMAASRHPYLYFRTINIHDTGYIGKHSGKWFAAWSPTRTEFATLHPENESVLMLWRM